MAKILDLKKPHSETSLVLKRPRRVLRNVLRFQSLRAHLFQGSRARAQAHRKSSLAPDLLATKNERTERRGSQFDLPQAKPEEIMNFYLPAKGPRQSVFARKWRFTAVAVAVVLVLNFAGLLGSSESSFEARLSETFQGLTALAQAAESFQAGNFGAAQTNFAQALNLLTEATQGLEKLGGTGVVFENKPELFKAGQRLILASKMLAEAGLKFAEAGGELETLLLDFPGRQRAFLAGESTDSLVTDLNASFVKIEKAFLEVENAAAILSLVAPEVLPAKFAKDFLAAREKLDFWLKELSPIGAVLTDLPAFLGERVPRKYLILFQNSAEIRPTGGFIGSVGILSLNDGYVTDFQIKDIYEIDGQLSTEIPPPAGFGIITNSWGLRDANWHPNFPTSARVAAWFFEEAGFGTVDGVFAVNASLLSSLVTEVGRLKLKNFEVSGAEILPVLSLLIESKQLGVENPKQILGEVWEVLREKLSRIPLPNLGKILLAARENKAVQFWSEVPELADLPARLGLAGALQEAEGDYLAVTHTSLSGNKSDAFMRSELTHATEISLSGTVQNRLTLRREHLFQAQDADFLARLAQRFEVNLTPELKAILGAGRNLDLVKVFVPQGARLQEITGVPLAEVQSFESEGKQVFSFILMVPAGAARVVSLKYGLPTEFQTGYSLVSDFQSGEGTRTLLKQVSLAGSELFAGEVNLGERLVVDY